MKKEDQTPINKHIEKSLQIFWLIFSPKEIFSLFLSLNIQNCCNRLIYNKKITLIPGSDIPISPDIL